MNSDTSFRETGPPQRGGLGEGAAFPIQSLERRKQADLARWHELATADEASQHHLPLKLMHHETAEALKLASSTAARMDIGTSGSWLMKHKIAIANHNAVVAARVRAGVPPMALPPYEQSLELLESGEMRHVIGAERHDTPVAPGNPDAAVSYTMAMRRMPGNVVQPHLLPHTTAVAADRIIKRGQMMKPAEDGHAFPHLLDGRFGPNTGVLLQHSAAAPAFDMSHTNAGAAARVNVPIPAGEVSAFFDADGPGSDMAGRLRETGAGAGASYAELDAAAAAAAGAGKGGRKKTKNSKTKNRKTKNRKNKNRKTKNRRKRNRKTKKGRK